MFDAIQALFLNTGAGAQFTRIDGGVITSAHDQAHVAVAGDFDSDGVCTTPRTPTHYPTRVVHFMTRACMRLPRSRRAGAATRPIRGQRWWNQLGQASALSCATQCHGAPSTRPKDTAPPIALRPCPLDGQRNALRCCDAPALTLHIKQ